MMPKCGKNNKEAHKPLGECVADVLATFWLLLYSDMECPSVLFIKEKLSMASSTCMFVLQ